MRATHKAGSRLVERVRVEETFEGATVWEGEVPVFEPQELRLGDGRPSGGGVLLHEGPVDGPEAAVRATIMAEQPT